MSETSPQVAVPEPAGTATVIDTGAESSASPPAPARWTQTGNGLHPGASRLILALIAVVAGISYTWGMASNHGHYFYDAAVRSMAHSWHDFVYGAFDPAGFITVDKAPGALWVQAISVHVFGYHTWALLLPEALAGVLTVLLLAAAVRRWAGDGAGLAAAAVFAATPIAVAAMRDNIPDPLLVLALVSAAYTFQRALDSGSLRWLAGTAVLVGLGFEVKLVPSLLILPVFGVVYLLAAAAPVAKRVGTAVAAGALALAVSAIWPLVIALTPASSRPYVDGSTSNSIWQMIWQYDAFGRVAGNGAPPSFQIPVLKDGQVVPVDSGGGPGLTRLFGTALGGQISWLLPLALIFGVAGLVLGRRAPRTDLVRAGWLTWGGWLVGYGLALSLTKSIHPYYTLLLAPPIAALVGAGCAYGFTTWTRGAAAWVLPAGLVVTAGWAVVVAGRSPHYAPWLRTLVIVAAIGALVVTFAHRRDTGFAGLGGAAVLLTAVALLAAPVAWARATFTPIHDARVAFFQGFNPVAGPDPNAQSTGVNAVPSSPGAQGAPAGASGQAPGGNPQGQAPGGNPQFPMPGGFPASGAQAAAAAQLMTPQGLMFWGMPTDADPKLIAYLRAHNSGERFDAAMTGGTAAAAYINAGLSIMPMGGFGGTIPAPTVAGLQQAVKSGQVRYVLLGGFAYDSPTGVARKAWVQKSCQRVNPTEYAGTPQMMFTSILFDCKGIA